MIKSDTTDSYITYQTLHLAIKNSKNLISWMSLPGLQMHTH